MKKLVTGILLVLYSFAMVGTTVAMHYCMGDQVGTSLGYSDDAACEYCHMDKHSNADQRACCSDQNQFVKMTSAQDITAFVVAPLVPFAFIKSNLEVAFSTSLTNHLSLSNEVEITPPDIPIYQRNCNFRI